MNEVRPLQDRVLIERVKEEEKSKGGIIIPDTAEEKPIEGEVIAVGNGKVLEDGTVRTLDARPAIASCSANTTERTAAGGGASTNAYCVSPSEGA